ncbi:MAG: hypothetical protein RBG13Loki_2318 [Promethearchaeota archaeon CR_4]|nr:MAG: hypothetical protein RBG13Loki_2318 [Candidatus Lokiarchaeota archaeon CR_4]
MVAGSPADEIVSLLRPIMDNIALVLSNGVIIFSNFAEDAIYPLVRYVKDLESQVQPGYFLRQDYMVSFRLSDRVFILALSNLPDSDIIPLFSKLYENYSEQFNALYQKLPKTLGDISKVLIFAMALDAGPEPITWEPSTLPEQEMLEYATKSMLTLAGEWSGATQNVVAYRPFIKEGFLGIIFLFDIPYVNARGHAYDSALILIVDYKHRAFVYEINQKIEDIFSRGVKQLIPAWQDRKTCKKIVGNLMQSLQSLPLRVSALGENIKDQMLSSMQDLRKI